MTSKNKQYFYILDAEKILPSLQLIRPSKLAEIAGISSRTIIKALRGEPITQQVAVKIFHALNKNDYIDKKLRFEDLASLKPKDDETPFPGPRYE
jgi:hypothetical protein